MLYNFAGLLLFFAVLLLLYLALRVFFSKGWFKAWLKGSFAMVAVVAAGFLVVAGLDLFGYTPYQLDHQVAMLEVKELESQQYELKLSVPGETDRTYMIHGDLWQLDARVIVWSGFYSLLGMKTAYRLERVSGRYYSLEEEVNKPRTVYELRNADSPVDIWAFIARYPWMPGVEARYGSGTYVPMRDGAVFTVHVRKDGLLTKPHNESAQKAIYGWK